jgi:hypothetical protein
MSDSQRRRRAFLWLAAVMFIGFFMPVWMVDRPGSDSGGSGLVIPNIEAMADEGIGLTQLLTLLHPLLASLIVFGVAWWSKPRVRAIVVVALAVIPVAIGVWQITRVASEHGYDSPLRRFLSSSGFGEGESFGTVLGIGLLAILAWSALLVGVRARFYRPFSQAAYAFGVAGASLLGALLLVIVVSRLTPYHDNYRDASETVFYYGRQAAWVCMIVAAVLCLLNVPRNEATLARRRARQAFAAFLVAQVIFGLAILASVGVEMYGPSGYGREYLTVRGFLLMLKIFLLAGPVLLLIPFGLSDLIVGDGEPDPEAPPGA